MFNRPDKLIGVPENYKPHPKSPQFERLLLNKLPPAPLSVLWAQKITYWGMDNNDIEGDCVEAAAAHLLNLLTAWAENGPATIMTGDLVSNFYSEVTGFNPNIPGTDQGTIPEDAWNYWVKTGVTTSDGVDKIIGYVNIDQSNLEHVKLAIDWFGGILVSWALPRSFQTAKIWQMPTSFTGDNAPYSWGGHETMVGMYNEGNFETVTWGGELQFDPALFNSPYCTGITAVITRDWFRKTTNQTPCLMDMQALNLAVSELKAA